MSALDRLELLIVDELGYLSLSRAGAELLFQVVDDRYERRSSLITGNLPFGEWGQVFQGERMTAALLDRLTHRCHIFEMNGESYRFLESVKAKKDKDTKKAKCPSTHPAGVTLLSADRASLAHADHQPTNCIGSDTRVGGWRSGRRRSIGQPEPVPSTGGWRGQITCGRNRVFA